MPFPTFKISAIGGNIPTVNQLGENSFGWNQVDGKLYGFKKTAGGIKSIVCINGFDTGVLPPEYIASVQDGMFDLGVTSGALQVAAYADKKSADPGFAYFYKNNSWTFADQFNSNYLFLDGGLFAGHFQTERFDGDLNEYSGTLMQTGDVEAWKSSPDYQAISSITPDSIRISYRNYVYDINKDHYTILRITRSGEEGGTFSELFSAYINNGLYEFTPLYLEVSKLVLPQYAPNKFLKINANREVEGVDGITLAAADNILHWDGEKYVPYENAFETDPGFPYFGIGISPRYYNELTLDGSLRSKSYRVDDIYNSESWWKYFYMSVLYEGTLDLGLVAPVNYEDQEAGYDRATFLLSVGDLSNAYIKAGKYHNSDLTWIPIRIGDSFTRDIVIDPEEDRFDINMTKTRLNKLTADKWLKLNANKEIECVDPPTSTGSITIPTLKLEAVHQPYFNDQLKCFWESNAVEFLNHNPEIWVFTKKKTRRKLSDNITSIIKRRWSHCSHLNGIKYPGSKFYAGAINSACNEIIAAGRNTEFELTTQSGQKQVVQINPWDYFYGILASDGSYVKLNDNYDFELLSDVILEPGNLMKMSIGLRFAIVIDNPNYVEGQNNPKIIGEKSDIVYMRCRTEIATGNTVPKIRFHADGVGVRMFGPNRY